MKIFFLILIVGLLGCSEKKRSFDMHQTTPHPITAKHSVKQPIKLKWLAQWKGEGKKEQFIREIAQNFGFLNQDIDLELVFPSDTFVHKTSDELFNAVNNEIIKSVQSSHWNWDIMLCDFYNYRDVGIALKDANWGATHLVDFSQYSWFLNAHSPGIINDNIRQTYGGIVPGAIIEGVSEILFFSEEVANELKIDVKRKDMTLSDFMKYAKVVDEYNDKTDKKITFLTSDYTSLQKLFNFLLLSAYGQNAPNDKNFGIATARRLYEKLEELSLYNPLKQHSQIDDRSIGDNRVLFRLYPSWIYQFWSTNSPNLYAQMKPCELPSFDGSKPTFYPSVWQPVFVVPKNAINREAAERLMKFITSKDVADKWVNYSKCPTGLVQNLAYNDFGQGDFELFYRHIQEKYPNNQISIDASSYIFSSKSLDFSVSYFLEGNISKNDVIGYLQSQLN